MKRAFVLPASLLLTAVVAAGCGSAIVPTSTVEPSTVEPTTNDQSAVSDPSTETTSPDMTAPETTTSAPAPVTTRHGHGDDVVTIPSYTGPRVVKFSCPSCSDNVIVQTDGAEGGIVNTIGSYTGSHWIDLKDGSTTTRVTIQAHGSWTLTVGGLDLAKQANGAVSGTGDEAILDQGSGSSAVIENHGGQSNFIVQYASMDTGDMGSAVNEIGGYSGTVELPMPSAIQVQSDGRWSITPQ